MMLGRPSTRIPNLMVEKLSGKVTMISMDPRDLQKFLTLFYFLEHDGGCTTGIRLRP